MNLKRKSIGFGLMFLISTDSTRTLPSSFFKLWYLNCAFPESTFVITPGYKQKPKSPDLSVTSTSSPTSKLDWKRLRRLVVKKELLKSYKLYYLLLLDCLTHTRYQSRRCCHWFFKFGGVLCRKLFLSFGRMSYMLGFLIYLQKTFSWVD